jgi:V8-like Glu-specific endopeptidase
MNIRNRSYHRLAGGLLFVGAIAAGTIAFIGHVGDGVGVQGRRLQGNSQGNQGQGGGNQGQGRPNADGSCGRGNNPVCVDGEITYQTACMAQAQGETVYTNGPCSGTDMAQFNGNGAASAAEMGRFKGEGFKLVGKVTNIAEPPPEYTSLETDDSSPIDDSPGQVKKLMRITSDGLKYVSKEHIPGPPMQQNTPDLGKPEAPLPDPGFVGVRKLSIIGTDTRSKISTPHQTAYYWRLGEFDWGSGEGGCSGSIVGPNKVLTAAHCVYDTFNDQW